MDLKDINLRDPYILPYNGRYYLYGTRGFKSNGFDVYISENLEHWSEPRSVFEYYDGFWADKEFWAPEVYEYGDKFVMFASFKNDKRSRGTQVLIADSPDGMFREYSREAVTPAEWDCLDGTLYIENGEPYMIFCHEWLQIKNGTVCSIKLSDDLKKAVSKPRILWRAKDADCFKNTNEHEGYITDGPFMIKVDDELLCFWSTICNGKYMELISRSDNGRIDGKWSIDKEAFIGNDGGHGMVFKTFTNEYKFIYHSPNVPKNERPVILCIELSDLKGNYTINKTR